MGGYLPQGGRAAIDFKTLFDERIDLLLANCKCLHDNTTCCMIYISNDRL
jgi:hypothetical protein